jgi:ABC-type transport system substrate-binding protein
LEERKEIYRQVEEILLDDAPFLFLYWRVQAEASVADLKGYQRFNGVSGVSEAFLENLWFDK